MFKTLTAVNFDGKISSMAKRITANLPETLLDEAMAVTGKGITATLIAGLELIRRSRAHAKAANLRGRIHLHIDLKSARERVRR